MSGTHQTTTTWDRVGAACGAAYVLLIIVGNQMAAGNSTDPHPSGTKDLADFAAHESAVQVVGFTLEVTGMLLFMFFAGWLVHRLRAHGGPAPWLAGAAGVAATTTLAVKIASVMPMVAGRLDHAELSPTTARVLTDMNGGAFVVTFLTFGAFLTAVGLAALTSAFLGRFAGWSAVVIGVLGVGLTLAARIDPVSSNPMPFMAGLLWILVVSVRLAWKGPRAVPEHVPARVVVPA